VECDQRHLVLFHDNEFHAVLQRFFLYLTLHLFQRLGLNLAQQEQRTDGAGENALLQIFSHVFSPWLTMENLLRNPQFKGFCFVFQPCYNECHELFYPQPFQRLEVVGENRLCFHRYNEYV
jgi:hypothetical protein